MKRVVLGPDVSEWCRSLHDRAMAAADEGDRLLFRGHARQARSWYIDARGLEVLAAQAADTEPIRAWLYLSAAWLACTEGWAAEAMRLAKMGLRGEGLPPEVVAELNAAWQGMVRHLQWLNLSVPFEREKPKLRDRYVEALGESTSGGGQ